MLTHLGGNRYEFLMQLLIIKDLLVAVVDSYEGLPMRNIRMESVPVFLFSFFNSKDKSNICDCKTSAPGVFVVFTDNTG